MRDDIVWSQRVAILFDSANICITSREMGVKVDFSKILERVNGRPVVRCIAYHPERNPAKEAPFLKKIQSIGFEVKTKRVKTYANGNSKGDMDVDIAVDAIALSEKCDVITLVSGDGDYAPLVRYLKTKGIRTEVIAFEWNTSRELRQSADEFYPITKDMLLGPDSER